MFINSFVPFGTNGVEFMVQKQKLVESEGLQAAVRLSKADYTKVQQLVDAGLYRSFADFLREAVRDKLGSMEVVSVTKVETPVAERMIEDYLKEHPGPNFASEIADATGLEFSITFKTIHKLLEKGRIKKTKA
jgi:Arc/MetJ-type ribon-helix-helix transcriptional regulator